MMMSRKWLVYLQIYSEVDGLELIIYIPSSDTLLYSYLLLKHTKMLPIEGRITCNHQVKSMWIVVYCSLWARF